MSRACGTAATPSESQADRMIDDIPTFNGGGDKAAAAAARLRRQVSRDALGRMRERAAVEGVWRQDRIAMNLDGAWQAAVASFRERHAQPTEEFSALGEQ